MDARDPRRWRPKRYAGASAEGRFDDAPTGSRARLPGLTGIRTVPWASIPEHAIIIGGANVNGSPLQELLRFPPVDSALHHSLVSRYRFLENHTVLVAEARSPVEAVRLSESIRAMHAQITGLRDVLGDFEAERGRLLGMLPGGPDGAAGWSDTPLWDIPGINEPSRLVKDRYASFTLSLAPGREIPSFLKGTTARRITVAEVLTHELSGRRYLPDDAPVRVHVALDCSYSMRRRGKLDYAVGAVNQLVQTLGRLLTHSEFKGYVFSSRARSVRLPIERVPLTAADTMHDRLFTEVLRNRAPHMRNKLIVISDGEPTDPAAAKRAAEALRRRHIDYTQVLLHDDDELRYVVKDEYSELETTDGIISDESIGEDISRARTDAELNTAKNRRFDTYTEIAELAGGNQVILTLHDVLGLLTVEVYDRYLGLLTLAAR